MRYSFQPNFNILSKILNILAPMTLKTKEGKNNKLQPNFAMNESQAFSPILQHVYR